MVSRMVESGEGKRLLGEQGGVWGLGCVWLWRQGEGGRGLTWGLTPFGLLIKMGWWAEV